MQSVKKIIEKRGCLLNSTMNPTQTEAFGNKIPLEMKVQRSVVIKFINHERKAF